MGRGLAGQCPAPVYKVCPELDKRTRKKARKTLQKNNVSIFLHKKGILLYCVHDISYGIIKNMFKFTIKHQPIFFPEPDIFQV